MAIKRWQVFAREYVVSLFPATHLVDSLGYSIKRHLGQNAGAMGCKLQDHAVWWLVGDGWRKLHLRLVEKISQQPTWFPQQLIKIEQLASKLVKLTKILARGKLNGLSSNELARRYHKFRQENIKLYDIGLLCPLLDYQNNTYLSDEVNKILQRQLTNQQIAEYFTVLTTPLRLSPDQLQEIGLLKLYAELSNQPSLLKCLKGNSAVFFRVAAKYYPGWLKRFTQHTKIYAALPYVYEGPAAANEYFLDLLRDYKKRNLNAKVALKIITNRQIKNAKLQSLYFKNLKLNKADKQLVLLARDLTFIKPFRRSLQSQAYYEFEPVLKEIARRLNLSIRQVRYLLPDEINTSLKTNSVNTGEINSRIKQCLYLNSDGRVTLLSGKSVDRFWLGVEKEKIPKGINKLVGTVACVGQARGRVCIVNTPDDMTHMKPGDILVSFATSPNLMPAIRQAAAIVTDEGGLTSHAAIVSRELKIPCIIGTKFATKVLANGDWVKVDATKGVVIVNQ